MVGDTGCRKTLDNKKQVMKIVNMIEKLGAKHKITKNKNFISIFNNSIMLLFDKL